MFQGADDRWPFSVSVVIGLGLLIPFLIREFLAKYRTFSTTTFLASITVINVCCSVLLEMLGLPFDLLSLPALAMLIADLHSGLRKRFKPRDILLIFVFSELCGLAQAVLRAEYSLTMTVAAIAFSVFVYLFSRYYVYCLGHMDARLKLYAGHKSRFAATATACADCFVEFCGKLPDSALKAKHVKRFFKDYLVVTGISLLLLAAVVLVGWLVLSGGLGLFF